jgi:hypothetical protein
MPHHIVSPFVPPKKYGSKGGEPWQLVARRVYYGLVAWCFSPSFKPPCSTGGVSGVDYDYNGYNDAMAMTTAMVMATTTAAKAGDAKWHPRLFLFYFFNPLSETRANDARLLFSCNARSASRTSPIRL